MGLPSVWLVLLRLEAINTKQPARHKNGRHHLATI